MVTPNSLSTSVSKISHSPKATALESTLQQCLVNFHELLLDFDQLQIDTEKYKKEVEVQKEKCETKTCSSSKALSKVMELVASKLTILSETKNYSMISDIFNVIFGEDKKPTVNNICVTKTTKEEPKNDNNIKMPTTTNETLHLKDTRISPKKELITSKEDCSIKDDSVSEIDGTPGRISPIIHSKKFKSSEISSPSTVSGSLEREKKKCPESWKTPERKQAKLMSSPHRGSKGDIILLLGQSQPAKTKGTRRLKQTRFTINSVKQTNVVDLTSSPNCCNAIECASDAVKPLAKKESSENDETIMPSPTSGPAKFLLSEPKTQGKFKKPLLSLSRVKNETVNDSPIISYVESKLEIKREDTRAIVIQDKTVSHTREMEDSINILNPNRFKRSPKNRSPEKLPKMVRQDNDVTNCDSLASESLLQRIDRIECNDKENINRLKINSPTKRPLVENINVMNTSQDDTLSQSSLSLLEANEYILDAVEAEDNAKRNTPEKLEPVYKEAAVRKKADKMGLPAWCCDECRRFLDTLYPDDPDKILEVVKRCSKHRGRINPVRPKTPTGFWDPRWDAPENTEELNRMNDAI